MSNSTKPINGSSPCSRAQNIERLLDIFALFATLFFVVASPKAEAYIDPSTGSYIIELTAGAFFTLMFSAKCFFKTLKQRLAFSASPEQKK